VKVCSLTMNSFDIVKEGYKAGLIQTAVFYWGIPIILYQDYMYVLLLYSCICHSCMLYIYVDSFVIKTDVVEWKVSLPTKLLSVS